jgi:pectate lyase-like protein
MLRKFLAVLVLVLLAVPAHSRDLVDTDSVQTLENKTLIAPILSAVTLNVPILNNPVFSGTATGTYTLGGTLSLSSPILIGTATGTYTLGGSPTLVAAVLSGTMTGTYTLAGTPTITSPAISSPTFSGTAIGTYTLGGTPTITAPILSGSVTGTYTLAGTPTGSLVQALATGSTTARSLATRFLDILNVKDFGAVVDGVANDTAAIQLAIDAAVAGGGGIVFFPPGFYKTTAALTITKGIVLQGSGMGVETGAGNSGGTVIRNASAGGDVITISSLGSVILKDFAIDAPAVTKSAGTAGVRIQGAGGSGNTNNRTRLENVRISNMYDGVVWDTASNVVLHGCHIQDYLNVGVYSKQTGGVDSGHNTIDSSVIWDLNVGTSQANIRYDKGGDLRIVNNKLLGGTYGVRVVLDDGETGTMLMTGNSFEEHKTNDIRIGQATVGKNFGNVVIVGNQFSTVTPPTPQSNIAVIAGTAGGGATSWLKNISITGNVINNAHNAAYAAISVQDGEGVAVAANTISGGGQANPLGIDVGGSAVSGKITGNVVFDMPGGNYTTSSVFFKVPTAILTFSSDVGGVAAGATAYLGAGIDTATEGFVQVYVPYKCVLLNLHAHANTAPVGAETYTYTLRVNGSDTALTSQVTGANTDGQDRTNAVAVPSPAGPSTVARISLKVVASVGAAVGVHVVTVEVTEDDA